MLLKLQDLPSCPIRNRPVFPCHWPEFSARMVTRAKYAYHLWGGRAKKKWESASPQSLPQLKWVFRRVDVCRCFFIFLEFQPPSKHIKTMGGLKKNTIAEPLRFENSSKLRKNHDFSGGGSPGICFNPNDVRGLYIPNVRIVRHESHLLSRWFARQKRPPERPRLL